MWSEIIWRQFGAAIDMLADSVRECPEALWAACLWEASSEQPEFSSFWYTVYHTLFWLDLYLTGSEEGFAPPPPFTLAEMDPEGLLPDERYTKAALVRYLTHCREKCRTILEGLTDEQAQRRCTFSWGEISYGELLLYTMRHVQEHAAQLSLFLGQEIGASASWVGRARDD